MMGSAATKQAAADRKAKKLAEDDAFREAKRALALQNAQAKIDARKANLDSKLGIRETKADTASSVALQRAAAEATQVATPIQSAAAVDATDAEARAKLIKALPWIIGGIGVVVAVFYLRKKKSKGGAA